MTYHWDRFTRMKYVTTSVEELFDYWTKPDQVTKWFLKKATYFDQNGTPRSVDEYPQVGDEYYWEWIQDLQTRGKVIRVDHNKLFEVTFGKNGETGEDILVTVTFSQEGEESIMRLEQSNMGGNIEDMAHYHLSCNKGWDYFMTNLKALINFGIDFREHDPDRAYNEVAVSL